SCWRWAVSRSTTASELYEFCRSLRTGRLPRTVPVDGRPAGVVESRSGTVTGTVAVGAGRAHGRPWPRARVRTGFLRRQPGSERGAAVHGPRPRRGTAAPRGRRLPRTVGGDRLLGCVRHPGSRRPYRAGRRWLAPAGGGPRRWRGGLDGTVGA